jgi:DNA modification methylase
MIVRGDCYALLPSFADGSVDAIITDPPYNVVNRKTAGIRSMDKAGADSRPVDIPRLAFEFVRIANGSIYVWCGTEQVSEWRAEFVAYGLTTRQCVWIKSDPSPVNGQHLWLSGVELCVYARKPKAPFYRHCKTPAWTGKVERVEGFPCPKPVWLMRELIEASVPEDGLILDPFCGSASVGVAAQQTGRRFLGIEIDDVYASIAETRLGVTA